MKKNWLRAEKILKKDGIVVLPTDTLYGVIGSALSKRAVKRIYDIKARNTTKPFIVLINSYKQLEIFGIKLDKNQAQIFSKFWPGKVSVLLPCKSPKWEYIHRGTKKIAFRMIGTKNKNLFNLIDKVGPLVAPSANIEGGKPAENIKEAKNYFGDKIELYINVGKMKLIPSTLIEFNNNKITVLRQGEIVIKEKE